MDRFLTGQYKTKCKFSRKVLFFRATNITVRIQPMRPIKGLGSSCPLSWIPPARVCARDWRHERKHQKCRIPGSRRNMQSYTLSDSRLTRQNLWWLWVLSTATLNFCIRGTPPQNTQWVGGKGAEINEQKSTRLTVNDPGMTVRRHEEA